MRGQSQYRVGTLVYTRAALVQVMFWMLLGDFVLTLMESSVPAILPLQLRWADGSDFEIALLALSIPAVLTMILAPIVGVQSDQCRSPMGRRRPFFLWFSPCVVASLLLLGFAQPLSVRLAEMLPGVKEAAMLKGLLALGAVCYTASNVYILSNYQFLIKDIIPEQVLGKFIGFFRAVGGLGGFAFNRFVFSHVHDHTAEVYMVCALVYAAGFALLFLLVREGEYPPIKRMSGGGARLDRIREYCRRCFGHGFYLKIYAQSFCYWSGWVPFTTFIVFFATMADKPGYAATLGLSVEDFGKIKAWTLLVQIPVFFIAGWLGDRFHPLRVQMVSSLVVGFVYLTGFFTARTPDTFLLWWICSAASCAAFLASYLTSLARLFPAAHFGECVSANTIIFHLGLIFSPMLAAQVLQWTHDYRVVFLWTGAFSTVGGIITIFLYRDWLRLGGDAAYKPPGEEPDRKPEEDCVSTAKP
ncbi:MAG: hypothetical protein BGO12_18070 [Verrucomicrobia bacterium 61-8]|nr:MFS transporter [Verrucomicrobiota bacterium]OJV16303.1 MAG: hypothetical protein BGO12_18070 [Verrucomicrobia bacterium 61-8]